MNEETIMVESIQHKLDRVRPPRVQITYDVEIGDAIEMKELPFVVGILSDLSGHLADPLPPLKERKFVEIDRDNFTEVFESIRPRLNIKVPYKLSADKEELPLELFFTCLEDFEPLNIIKRVDDLTKLYDSRSHLKDLMNKLDGNDVLSEMLTELMTDSAKQTGLSGQIDAGSGEDLDKLLTEGKMVRDESQKPFVFSILKEFLAQVAVVDESAPKIPGHYLAYQIDKIDNLISLQINEILHQPDFMKLEGSWRGLAYLVFKAETGEHLKLRLLNLTRHELQNDLDKAVEFDQSQLFKKVYEEEYGTFGGHPYSCLLGDFEFGRSPMDMDLLEKISGVAAAAHAPFISAAHPMLFDLDSFEHLGIPRDITKIMDSLELVKWHSFRSSPDSRYVSLVLPRVLMRLPYGPDTSPVEGFDFKEDVGVAESNLFCWGNAAYILAERICNAFSLYKWTAAIRGVEGGGIVEGLPPYTFKTPDGDIALKCPTEVSITDRREKELNDNGFIALCHCKGTDYAAFFGGQTSQKPKKYNLDDATANANLSCRLPYILAASRFAHYIKVIMRDKIGSFMTKENVSSYLNTWIAQYVLLNDDAPQEVKARYPLREARIDVFEIPGQPGSYTSVAYIKPHFQLEDLSVSIRLVAKLPKAPS